VTHGSPESSDQLAGGVVRETEPLPPRDPAHEILSLPVSPEYFRHLRQRIATFPSAK
jgi:hypothetical protein